MPKVSFVQRPCRTATPAPFKSGQSDAQLKPFSQNLTQPVFQPPNAQTVSIQRGSLTTEPSISTAAVHVRARRFGGMSSIIQLLVTGLLLVQGLLVRNLSQIITVMTSWVMANVALHRLTKTNC